MTNTISPPLTKTMSISEAEKEISKYTDETPILITYSPNANISDLARLEHAINLTIKCTININSRTILEDKIG